MFKVKRMLLGIILVMFFLIIKNPVFKAYANDTVLGMTPDGVYPISQSDIMMESEEINIRMIDANSAKVTCRFDFRNFGGEQDVLIGFPAMLDEEITEFSPEDSISIRNFTAHDENGEIPVELNSLTNNPQPNPVDRLTEYSKWYSFKVSFKEGQSKSLFHTYDIKFTHDSIGNIYLGYVLETGALWKGPINHSKVVFDLGNIPLYYLTDISPNNFFKIEGNQLIWERKNYKPDYNLWVTLNTYHFSEDYLQYADGNDESLKAREKIEFMSTLPDKIQQDRRYYYSIYENLALEKPIEALYVKSLLNLPNSCNKPVITEARVIEKHDNEWRFEVYGTDPDVDIIDCKTEIKGISDYKYIDDIPWRKGVYYDIKEGKFIRQGYLTVLEPGEFTITFTMTDAVGNTDTETLILKTDNQTPQTTSDSQPSTTQNAQDTEKASIIEPEHDIEVNKTENGNESGEIQRLESGSEFLVFAVIFIILLSIFLFVFLKKK